MKTLNASELMVRLKERKHHEPTDADFTYAEPEPRIDPAVMPSGEGTRFWEK